MIFVLVSYLLEGLKELYDFLIGSSLSLSDLYFQIHTHQPHTTTLPSHPEGLK